MSFDESQIGGWIARNAIIVASIGGSFIADGFTELRTWRQKAYGYASGAIMAKYATPFLAAFFSINPELTAFFIGLFGLSLVGAGFKIIRKFGDEADLWYVVQKAFGLSKKDGEQ